MADKDLVGTAEIAKRLGKSPRWVSQTVYRAKKGMTDGSVLPPMFQVGRGYFCHEGEWAAWLESKRVVSHGQN